MDLHTKLIQKNSYTSSQPLHHHVQENYLLKPNMMKLDDHHHHLPSGLPNSSSSSQGFLQEDCFNINYHNNIDHHFHLNGPSSVSSNPLLGAHQTLSYDCFDHDFDVYEGKAFVDDGHNNVPQIMDNFKYGPNYSCLNNYLPQRNQVMVDMNNQSYVAYNSHQELTKPVDFVIADEVSCISPSSVDFYKRVGFNYKKNNRASSLSTRRTNLKVRKKSNMVKGQWTIEEDRVLIQLVEQYGLRKWSHIAQMLPGRIGKQCRERWHNHLKPDIKKETWTEEEDKILIEAHGEVGNKWAEIAKRLVGRTENSIKNHWNATKRRQYSKRKCRSKYPTPSLLQQYIKTLNFDQNPPIDYRKKISSLPSSSSKSKSKSKSSASVNNNNNHIIISSNTTNTIQMSISKLEGCFDELIKGTSDFCFDERLFQEECVQDDDDVMAEKGFEVIKKELDLVEMMSQVNQVIHM